MTSNDVACCLGALSREAVFLEVCTELILGLQSTTSVGFILHLSKK